MDKLLQSTFDLAQNGDLKKILKAIEQTNQLPELLALGFFALIRREAKRHAGLDIEAIETAIAGSNRVGLNPAQVAEQLKAQINQRSTLTKVMYRVVADMLEAILIPGALPSLCKDGIIQLDAFAELVRRADEPAARRALEKGLYDWRGRPRPDTTALAATLPFLKPDIDRFARRSVLAYPAGLLVDMKDAFIQGRAPAGFFGLAMTAVVVVLVIVLATRSTGTSPATEAPKVDAKPAAAPVAPTLYDVLLKTFSEEKVRMRYQGATILVLDDDDAHVIIEVLTKTLTGEIIAARGAFGQAPEGCAWLEREDIQLIEPAPADDARIVVACFVRTPQGHRQFQLVALPSRTIEVAVGVPDAPARPVVGSDQYLTIAQEEYQSRSSLARAELAFRQAKFAARGDRTALGRYHRRFAAFLDFKKASTAEIAEQFRLAARYLPPAEYAEIPEAIRRQYKLQPTLVELESRMTTIARAKGE
jgi:hypothetical protein